MIDDENKGKLAVRLAKVIGRYEPKLNDMDVDTSMRVASLLAGLLGVMMATLIVRKPDTYLDILTSTMRHVDDVAVRTSNNALARAKKLMETLQ